MAKKKQEELQLAYICVDGQKINTDETPKSTIKEIMDKLFEEKRPELVNYIMSRPRTQAFLKDVGGEANEGE